MQRATRPDENRLQNALFADRIREFREFLLGKGLAGLQRVRFQPADGERALRPRRALASRNDRSLFADEGGKPSPQAAMPAFFRALAFACSHAAAARSRWITSPASLMYAWLPGQRRS